VNDINRTIRKAIVEPRQALLRISRYLTRSLNTGLRLYTKGYSYPVEKIIFNLTYRCNLRCKMCLLWGDSGVYRNSGASLLKQELSLDELKLVIDDVLAYRPDITLSGGEPLLHGSCLDLVRYCSEKGLRTHLITNGILVTNFAEEIVDSHLHNLNISLDGPPEINDEIRGIKGGF